MGRIVSLGIQSASVPNMIMGTTAERPSAVNAGITFYNSTTNQLEVYNGSTWHPVNDYQRVDVSSSTTVTSNKSYWVNTSSGAVTITLPSSPNPGDFIKVTDVAGTFGTNNCIIANNGRPIMRQNDTMTISTNGASVRMVYYDNTRGWLLEAI
jgi:hypothetical protein